MISPNGSKKHVFPSASRHQARELALQLLYAIEMTGFSLDSTLTEYAALDISPKVPINNFTRTLLDRALTHQPELDERLRGVIMNWRLERLSSIDRNLLRLATVEIYYFDDIPPKVTINEYIEIAKDFGDNDSPSFINGILDRIARESAKGKEIGKNSP